MHIAENQNPIVDTLKQHYSTAGKIKRLFFEGEFELDDIYVNLAMVKQEIQKEQEKKLHHEKPLSALDRLGFWETLHGEKETIKLQELFSNDKEAQKEIQRVLIVGRAGIGKSTLCHYIGYQASQGLLWKDKFPAIIILNLRNLTTDYYRKKATLTIADVIHRELFDNNTAIEKITEYWQTQSKKTLLVLDGYDEITSFWDNYKDSDHSIAEVIKELLNHPCLIVTTRPYAIPEGNFDRRVENMGFTDEAIKHYVEKFMGALDKADKGTACVDWLIQNPNIWGIAHIPINLELICSLWVEQIDKKQNFTQYTMSSLYDELSYLLCKRYLENPNCRLANSVKPSKLSRKKIAEYSKNEMCFLEHLAFEGLQTEKLLLPNSLINKVLERPLFQHKDNMLEDSLTLGFLKGIGNHSDMADKDYYFLHLTFQEYLAARFLASALQGENLSYSIEQAQEFFRTHKYTPRYTVLWWFLAGALRDGKYAKARQHFWDILLGEPTDWLGRVHLNMVLHCLEESYIAEKQYPAPFQQWENLSEQLRPWLEHYLSEQMAPREYYLKGKQPSKIRYWSDLIEQIPQIAYKLWGKDLLHHLENPRSFKKYSAIILLKDMQKLDESILQKYIYPGLQDSDSNTRREATNILSVWVNQGKASESWITQYILPQLTDNDNSGVSQSATYALVQWINQGKASESWITQHILPQLTDDGNSEAPQAAIHALVQWINQGKVSEKWITQHILPQLANENEGIRQTATSTLTLWIKQGKVSEKWITQHLLPQLRNKNWDVRRTATVALAQLISQGKASEEQITHQLLPQLTDENREVHITTTYALTQWIKQGKASEIWITQHILPQLTDENEQARLAATDALVQWINQGKASEIWITQHFLSQLTDENERNRQIATYALAEWIKQGKASEVWITQHFLPLLKNKNWDVRRTATVALAQLINQGKASEEQINQCLLPQLTDEIWEVQSAATGALTQWVKQGNASEIWITQYLPPLLAGKNEKARQAAIYALAEWIKQGKASKEQINQHLLPRLTDKNNWTCKTAIDALAEWIKQGKASEEQINQHLLPPLLISEDWLSRHAAAGALAQWINQGKASEEQINQYFLPRLTDKNEWVHQIAIYTLAQWIKQGKASEKFITKLVKDATRETLNVIYIGLVQNHYHHLKEQLTSHWKQPASFLEKPFANLLTALLENTSCVYIIRKEWWLIFNDGNAFVWPYPDNNPDSISCFEKALNQACSAWRGDAPHFPIEEPFRQTKNPPLVSIDKGEASMHEEFQRNAKKIDINLSQFVPAIKEAKKLLQAKKDQSANIENLVTCLGIIQEDIEQIKLLVHKENQTKQINHINDFYAEFKQKLQESSLNKNDKLLIEDKLKLLEDCLLQQKAEQQKLLIEKKLGKFSSQQKQHSLRLSQQHVEKHSKAVLGYLLKEIDQYRLKQHYSGGKLYICYAWAHPDYQQEESWEQGFLATLREHLRAAGITAILDIKDNQLGNNIYKFMEQAKTSDYVLVVGSQSLLKKHKQGITALATELIEILDKRRLDEKQGLSRVLPILLSGEIDSALPSYFRTYTTVRSWVGEGYLRCLRQLIERIYNIPEEDKTAGPFNNLWQQFLTQHPNAQLSYQPLPDAEIEKVIPKPVQAVKQKPLINIQLDNQKQAYQDCETLSKTAIPASNEKQKQQTLALCHRFFQTPVISSEPQDEAALKQICEQANPLQLSDESLDADKKIPLPAKETKKESRSNSEKAIPKSVQAVNQKQIYQDCETLAKTPVPASNEKQKQQTLALCHRFFQTPVITSEPQDEAALKQICEQANPLQETELLPNAVQNIQPIGKLFNTLCHWLSNKPANNSLNYGDGYQPDIQPK